MDAYHLEADIYTPTQDPNEEEHRETVKLSLGTACKYNLECLHYNSRVTARVRASNRAGEGPFCKDITIYTEKGKNWTSWFMFPLILDLLRESCSSRQIKSGDCELSESFKHENITRCYALPCFNELVYILKSNWKAGDHLNLAEHWPLSDECTLRLVRLSPVDINYTDRASNWPNHAPRFQSCQAFCRLLNLNF